MANTPNTPGIASHRLPPAAYGENFGDLHPPLTPHQALVAADRCYFCHDAPCVTACPTAIDIPLFIRQIATGTPEAAARTIFSQNIFGGICARVCPTETLCEQACVRQEAEGKPVRIGQLQRFATDTMLTRPHPFARAADSGKRVAVVGAGPAGLACAHRLAMHGHRVEVFDTRPRPGGLNEYGLAAYKTTNGFAAAEVAWLLQIGGITLHPETPLNGEGALARLKAEYDAVFLGIGLSGVNTLGLEGAELENIRNAVDFIAELRQSDTPAALPVGRHVVVIGGGMTAIDAAVQARLLGAETVTMVYRRAQAQMAASPFEQALATAKGVRIIHNATPTRFIGVGGAVAAVEFATTRSAGGALVTTDETFTLPADQVLSAIGQRLGSGPLDGLALEGGKIRVSKGGQSSDPQVWAGGDCASGGEDLTVTAVAQGRDAAEAIHQKLMAEG